MSTQDFVRAARESDAADVARIQVECWRHGYPGLIPDAVLAEMTSDDALAQWRERWGLRRFGFHGLSHRYAARVADEGREAAELGATGVPFFVIDRRYGVAGAQPVDTMLAALQRAWDERLVPGRP